MRKILYILLLMLACASAFAAKPSTEGTEFWVTFMKNYYKSTDLKLIASARENATIQVVNPKTNWSQSFSVKAGEVAYLTIPNNQAYMTSEEVVDNKGLLVTSSSPISLYASNFIESTFDATIVLPTTALGKDYIIQVFENDLYPKEFAIVATENNTDIVITPHARTTQNRLKNVQFTIRLNRGDTYQVMSTDNYNDFSGSRVESNKPIAVFAGHVCANVPTGNPWCDHIIEQQMPVKMWGKQFALTKTSSMNGDRVMITAKNDNTKVSVNGSVVATLNALESYSFRLTDNSSFVETTEPTACFLYIEGANNNNMNGDPSSVHISPIEQTIREITFATFQTDHSRTHYVNIVTTAEGAKSMMLDGKDVSLYFSPLKGNNKLSFARINIRNGTHTLRNNVDGFIGHVYGLGYCESYAYTIGSATIDLDGDIMVDGVPHADIVYSDERCYKQTIHFEAHTSVNFNSIVWNFGDGTTSTQTSVNHAYANPGTYIITMITANDDGIDTARTTLTLYETLHDTIYAYICQGEKYTLGDKSYDKTGKYFYTTTSKAGCDSVVMLDLTVNEKPLTIEDAEFYKGSKYKWHGKWYKKEGTYRDTLLSVHGCDSIVELHLVETDPTQIFDDTICWQAVYPYHGYDVPLPPIDDYKDQDYIDYTISYTDKKACITYRTNLAIVPKEGGGVYEIYDTIQSGQTYEWFGSKYTEEGSYTKIMGAGEECRQEYTLNLAVLPFPINITEMTLCHEDNITWHGKTYDKPGTYTDTIFSPLGIESINRLVLTDNRNKTELSVNTDKPYMLDGQLYDKSGTYTRTLTTVHGCDSIIILHLGINQTCTVNTEENIRICKGESVIWNGKEYSNANDYTWQTKSVGGCDSIVTLHLTLAEQKTTPLQFEICEGDFYRYGDDKLSDEGEYQYHFTTTDGCDSLVSITINHKKSFFIEETQTIFEGQSVKWQGNTYSEPGDYTVGFIAQNGCDSTLTLHILKGEKEIRTRNYEVVICEGESYDFYGEHLTAADIYTHNQTYVEYDSVVTLTLKVNPRYERDTIITIMQGESVQWGDNILSNAGIYPLYLTTVHGCDSIVNLILRVQQKDQINKATKAVICEGDTYNFYGNMLTESGTYTYISSSITADTTIILTLMVEQPKQTYLDGIIPDDGFYSYNGKNYYFAGDYDVYLKTKNGCDSIIILHLETAASQRIDNAAIGISSSCADDGFIILHIDYDNQPDSIKLNFKGRNNAQGFTPLTIVDVRHDITIAHEARAGNYSVETQLFKKNRVVKTIKTDFTILYPSSVIEQAWNDALIILTAKYNGGYDFKGFQWYKDGEIIEGENHSYMYQPLEMGAVYAAMLTEKDNTQLMTCGIIAVPHEEISLYPTQFRIGQRATCRVSSEAMMYVYDATGKMLYSLPLEEGESEQYMPVQQGLYIVRIVLNDSQHSQKFKIRVEG